MVWVTKLTVTHLLQQANVASTPGRQWSSAGGTKCAAESNTQFMNNVDPHPAPPAAARAEFSAAAAATNTVRLDLRRRNWPIAAPTPTHT
jgi:hypothetical protein